MSYFDNFGTLMHNRLYILYDIDFSVRFKSSI